MKFKLLSLLNNSLKCHSHYWLSVEKASLESDWCKVGLLSVNCHLIFDLQLFHPWRHNFHINVITTYPTQLLMDVMSHKWRKLINMVLPSICFMHSHDYLDHLTSVKCFYIFPHLRKKLGDVRTLMRILWIDNTLILQRLLISMIIQAC